MRIGIDLGGTKIAAVALDDAGRERAARRIATPRHDYDATLRAIAGLVAALEAEAGTGSGAAGPASVGVGMPGAVSPATGLVKNANSTWLNGRPFHRDLEAALGRPVRCANDANCLAVSEAVDGAAAGLAVVFAVILGTGVGAGLALGGRAHIGRNAAAGEWGHNPLPWAGPDEVPGPACWCGRRGCLETWLSGPGLAADYARAGGGELTGPEIVARAGAGEPPAAAALARWADRLARGLAHAINVIDPDVIVLGGGLSGIPQVYEAVPPRLPAYVFGGEADTPLRPARHGDASGVRGAAWLWPV